MQRPLNTLSVDLVFSQGSMSLRGLAHMFQTLLHHTCASTLTSLHVNTGYTDNMTKDDANSVGDSLRPLFSLPNLRDIFLRFSLLSELDDEWFKDAAPSWPHLESLDFYGTAGKPRSTLAGMLPLLQHCPQLRTYNLGVLAIPFDTTLSHCWSGNRGITEMRFAYSPLNYDDANNVSLCILLMFPNLKHLFYTKQHGEEEWDDGWERVLNLFYSRKSVSSDDEVWDDEDYGNV
ncbi:hypothetical protein DXG01_004795 [Tephrocybe rancida]|nr:hypothetical protein DXG01_004795 [Tephrocybe rancida]